jgi:hypothetical protein
MFGNVMVVIKVIIERGIVMRIKVLKANCDSYWYANHIGEEFDVEKDNIIYSIIDNSQISDCDNPESIYFLDENDCEVINEEDNTIENIKIKNKLYICGSYEEKNKIVDCAETLFLQYLVKKFNDNLWHVEVMFE